MVEKGLCLCFFCFQSYLLWNACRCIYLPYDIAPIMCFAPLNVRNIMSAWQDPEIQDGRETGFVFSLMEILHSVFLYRYIGLRRGLVDNSVLFPSFLTFSVHKEQNAHFSPCMGKCQERHMYKTSVREAASPPLQSLLAADRQAECSHLKLQNKENKLAGTHSWVPKDYFCSSPTCLQPVQ